MSVLEGRFQAQGEYVRAQVEDARVELRRGLRPRRALGDASALATREYSQIRALDRDVARDRIGATERRITAVLFGEQRRHRFVRRGARHAREAQAKLRSIHERALRAEADRRRVVVVLDQVAIRSARGPLKLDRQLLEAAPPGPRIVDRQQPVLDPAEADAALDLRGVRDLRAYALRGQRPCPGELPLKERVDVQRRSRVAAADGRLLRADRVASGQDDVRLRLGKRRVRIVVLELEWRQEAHTDAPFRSGTAEKSDVATKRVRRSLETRSRELGSLRDPELSERGIRADHLLGKVQCLEQLHARVPEDRSRADGPLLVELPRDIRLHVDRRDGRLECLEPSGKTVGPLRRQSVGDVYADAVRERAVRPAILEEDVGNVFRFRVTVPFTEGRVLREGAADADDRQAAKQVPSALARYHARIPEDGRGVLTRSAGDREAA